MIQNQIGIVVGEVLTNSHNRHSGHAFVNASIQLQRRGPLTLEQSYNRQPWSSYFRLPGYLKLKRQLGAIDAAAECLELAIREFVFQSKTLEKPDEFIKGLSVKHRVRVDAFDLDHFLQHSARLDTIEARIVQKI